MWLYTPLVLRYTQWCMYACMYVAMYRIVDQQSQPSLILINSQVQLLASTASTSSTSTPPNDTTCILLYDPIRPESR